MEGLFLDTNVFIAKMKESDKFKHDAELLLSRIEAKKHRVFSSTIVLMECAYVLKKFGRKKEDINKAIHALSEIEDIFFLPITAGIVKEASDLMLLYNIALSDAIIAATMSSNNIDTIVSEDEEDFGRIPFIKRISLKEAIGYI